MDEKVCGLEKVGTTVIGVVKCLEWGPMTGAHIETRRSIEDSLWKLAMKAGYKLGDRVEYEISVRKKFL